MVKRIITSIIRERYFEGKAIVITGPRQVGKTTLLRELAEEAGMPAMALNCDEPDVLALLDNTTSTQLIHLFGDKKLILIDEAQRVGNIGHALKLIVDNIPGVQVVATGSSSFDLGNALNESLTGRKFEMRLFPFSTAEMIANTGLIEEKRMLSARMVYGFYPDAVNKPERSRELLQELVNSYLFKDIFSFNGIRKPDLLTRLLTALALHLGHDISYNELSQMLGVDKETVERYIQLLEKCYVIFRLGSFSKDILNELKKSRKIYFYDNGVRNAILNNFTPLPLRGDVDALWENFLISERFKANAYKRQFTLDYFWRTHNRQEINLLEEKDGILNAFMFRWNPKSRAKIPNVFATTYPNHLFRVVTPENYTDFLLF